jgi:DNA-binding MarR family transcriptional regulator
MVIVRLHPIWYQLKLTNACDVMMSKPPARPSGPSVLSLGDFLPYRLSITAQLVSEVIATAYGALYGLKAPEWRVVATVAEAGELTQQGVCTRTRMDKVTVHRAAFSLCTRGLLDRSAHPGDRRSHHLALTATGRALYAEVAPRAVELERRLFSGFSADEIARLTDLLDAVNAAAVALLEAPLAME